MLFLMLTGSQLYFANFVIFMKFVFVTNCQSTLPEFQFLDMTTICSAKISNKCDFINKRKKANYKFK